MIYDFAKPFENLISYVAQSSASNFIILVPTLGCRAILEGELSRHHSQQIEVIAFENIHQDLRICELIRMPLPPALTRCQLQRLLMQLGVAAKDLEYITASIREAFEEQQILEGKLAFTPLQRMVEKLNEHPHEYLLKSQIAQKLGQLKELPHDLELIMVYTPRLPKPFISAINSLTKLGAKLYCYLGSSSEVATQLAQDCGFKVMPPAVSLECMINIARDEITLILALERFLQSYQEGCTIVCDDSPLIERITAFLQSMGHNIVTHRRFANTLGFQRIMAALTFKEDPSTENCYNLLTLLVDMESLAKIDREYLRNCYTQVQVRDLPIADELKRLLGSDVRRIVEFWVGMEIEILPEDYALSTEAFAALYAEQLVGVSDGNIKFLSAKDASFLHKRKLLVVNPLNGKSDIHMQLAEFKLLATNPHAIFLQLDEEDLSALMTPFCKGFVDLELGDYMSVNYSPMPAPSICVARELLPQTLSASAIEKLINNPYVFYVNYILRIKPLEEYGAGLQKMFGIIVHSAIANSLIKEDFIGEFSKAFNQELDALELPKMTRLQWQKRAASIARWLVANINFSNQKWLEVEGSCSFSGICLTSRADMIEQLDDAVAVVDFKTGAAPSQSQVNKGLKPQLAIEALILKHGGFPMIVGCDQPLKGRYYEIKGRRLAGDTKEIDLHLERANRGLMELISKFYRDGTDFFATPDDSYHSEAISGLIRRQEWF